MNFDEKHLVDMSGMTEEERQKLIDDNYELLEGKLAKLAELELAGRKECHVGKDASGTLSRLAREHRNIKHNLKNKV